MKGVIEKVYSGTVCRPRSCDSGFYSNGESKHPRMVLLIGAKHP